MGDEQNPKRTVLRSTSIGTPTVIIYPDLNQARAVTASHFLSTELLFGAWIAGQSVESISHWHDTPALYVEEAIRHEVALLQAKLRAARKRKRGRK